jgi:hypothetical protein
MMNHPLCEETHDEHISGDPSRRETAQGLHRPLPGQDLRDDDGGPPVDDAKVREATGKPLGDWFAILDERGARDLPHKDIARLLQGDYDVPGWWSQSVTVEYEKRIGRRETGQTQSGDYEANATRSVRVTMDAALDGWLARLPSAGPQSAFDGVEFAGEPSTSRTEKRRYWRVTLADDSRVTVFFSAKPDGEGAQIAVQHGKLAGRPDVDRWKAFWKAYLQAF